MRKGGEVISNTTKQWSLLSPGGNWELRADLDCQLNFPRQITITSLWPDIVLWSTTTRTVIMAELAVPWVDGLESAFERKKEKYAELAVACIEVEGFILSNGSWLPGLHWNIYSAALKVPLRQRPKVG